MSGRPSWDEYFLIIAEAAASRSDCERSKVGAVVVKDRRVRATGYNGAPAGQSGCASCPRRTAEAVPGVSDYNSGATRCVAVHAEANALLYCDREDLQGATLYVTREPCYGCSNLIAATGIKQVIWPEKLYQIRELYAAPQRIVFGVEGDPHEEMAQWASTSRILAVPEEVVVENCEPDLVSEIHRKCLDAMDREFDVELSEILSGTARNWGTVR